MPVEQCESDGKPGFRWGNSGACYTYNANDPASRAAARDKAHKQGTAIAFSRAKDRGKMEPTKKDYG